MLAIGARLGKRRRPSLQLREEGEQQGPTVAPVTPTKPRATASAELEAAPTRPYPPPPVGGHPLITVEHGRPRCRTPHPGARTYLQNCLIKFIFCIGGDTRV